MTFGDIVAVALDQIWNNKLRSFFTLLGIIVSVAFLVAVVAIIQGMNAYVKENVAGAVIGANAFQVRRTPISIGPFDDEAWKRVQQALDEGKPKSAADALAGIEAEATKAKAWDEVARAIALGATRIDIGQSSDVSWVVLADPEGNEFCILRARGA